MTFATGPTRRGEVEWRSNVANPGQSVETFKLRSGASLVLCDFGTGDTHPFRYTEPEDTFGVGFHLQGGARFYMECGTFATNALNVWATGAPRGSTSSFKLPRDGFRTASIRFDPEAASEWFEDGRALQGELQDTLERAHDCVGAVRLPSLIPKSVARLQSMFTTGYGGAARRLYLESCVLELVATQIVRPTEPIERQSNAHRRHRHRLFAARDHLDQNFCEPPTISELAKIVGTNEYTLKRGFRETFGTTIFAYVSRRRMDHATWLLHQGMSVSSAAREVGYECPRSFAAAYRRHVGHAPSVARSASI